MEHLDRRRSSGQNRCRVRPNEWLVDEIYQQYLQDPNSVDRAWWDFFADYKPGAPSARLRGTAAAETTTTAQTPAPARQLPAPAQAAPAAPAAPKPAAAPARLRRRPRPRPRPRRQAEGKGRARRRADGAGGPRADHSARPGRPSRRT
ncbi:hypothetical protein StrepF001_40190 [Streptomyces sp. F001]|nr:hypothetical protein StrepF001_40190 [Streptomyces sp. F001]